MSPSYCVICVSRRDDTTRVVGPFASQEAAVQWAVMMRNSNSAWNYHPEVMDAPTPVSTQPEADLELPEDGEPVTIEVVRGGPLVISAPTRGTFDVPGGYRGAQCYGRGSTLVGPEPQVTDGMVERALSEWGCAPTEASDREAMRSALEAALAFAIENPGVSVASDESGGT